MAENSFISSFKKWLIFFVKLALFVICLYYLIEYIGIKYAAATTENLINNYNESRWNEFYAQPKDSLDMVFIGSSHSYCTFDPEIIDKGLGTNSYQMGMPLQHMDSTYYTLREILNYQKPKTVVVEVYWDMLDDEFELTQAGYLFQVMKNSELEKEYIREVFPLSEKIMYNINIFRYQKDYFAYRNSKLKEKIENNCGVSLPAAQRQQGTEKYRSKGYTYCDYHMLPDEFDKTNQFKNLDGRDWEINDTQVKYLEKIVSLCKDNNIDVIFVTAPIANVSLDYIKNYDDIHNEIQKIADGNNVRYLDFNTANRNEKLFTHDNFRDDAHLNHSGVEIADRYFIDWFKKNM